MLGMTNQTTPGRSCPYIWDGVPPAEVVAKIRTCARLINRDPDAIDDIVQEVFLKLLAMPRHRWNTISNKEAYLSGMAYNISCTFRRRHLARASTLRSYMTIDNNKGEGPLRDLSDPACAVDDLLRVLEPLDPECAEVFVRVRLYERTYASVAETMNIPLSRVRTHLERADQYLVKLHEEDSKALSIKSRLVRVFKRG